MCTKKQQNNFVCLECNTMDICQLAVRFLKWVRQDPSGSIIFVVCHNLVLRVYFTWFLLFVRWQLLGRVPNVKEVRNNRPGLTGLPHCQISQCIYYK